jgi:hypothetical protein
MKVEALRGADMPQMTTATRQNRIYEYATSVTKKANAWLGLHAHRSDVSLILINVFF